MPSIFHTSFQSLLYILIIRLIVALTALPVHECAHAYAAMRMGDHTAERQGLRSIRLRTLTPSVQRRLFFLGLAGQSPFL